MLEDLFESLNSNIQNKDILLDSNVTKLLNIAKSAAAKNNQLFVNTARVFACILSFQADLLNEKEKETILKELEKVNITGKEFSEAFYELYPKGTDIPYGATVVYADELKSIIYRLKEYASMTKEPQGVKNLLNEIFSSTDYSLFQVFIKINNNRKEKLENSDNASKEKNVFDSVSLLSSLLDKVGRNAASSFKLMDAFYPLVTNINKYVEEKNPEIIGFDKELLALEVALSKNNKSTALVIGPAGTGKTSLVYKFAQAINKKEVPDEFKSVVLYELHLDSLVAGSMFRGQFEEKLINVLETAKKLTKKNIILFIDEFHTITSAGSNSQGDVNASNIIKPYITRGDISVIGASTNEEVNSYVETDKAISRRFTKILLNEPTKEEMKAILNNVIPSYENKYNKILTKECREEIEKVASQYNIQVSNPDRTLTILETVFAYSKIKHPNEPKISQKDIFDSLAITYNITAKKNRYAETIKELHSNILGEDSAIDEISTMLNLVDKNLCNPEKPKAVFMLAGPTGTGKTESAKIIAKYYTGSENNLVVVSGSSLIDQTSSSALFGTNAGYVGYQPTSPFLSSVKQNPNSVVLFDEIEKADSSVFKSLLQILDEGFIEDKIGNKISFRNCIIIFTTNLGFGTSAYGGTGIMSSQISSGSALKEIQKKFSPEFIGRLNKIVFFKYLSDDVANILIERYRKKYNSFSRLNIKFDDNTIKKIKENAKINTLGARILETAVKNEMLNQLENKKKNKLLRKETKVSK